MKRITATLSLILIAGLSCSSTTWAASDQSEELKSLRSLVKELTVDSESATTLSFIPGTSRSQPYSVWARYSHDNYDDDRPGNAKDGSGHTYALGFGYQVSNRLLLGLGVLNQDFDTTTDKSPAPLYGYSEIEHNSDGLFAYGNYILDNGLILDASLSYSNTDVTITDASALASPTEKSTDGNDYSASIGARITLPLNASNTWFDSRVSFTHAWGSQDSYRDVYDRYHDSQDYSVGTLGMTTNIYHQLTPQIQPYAGLILGYDLYSDSGDPALVMNPGGSIATSAPFQEDRKRFSHGFKLGAVANISKDIDVRLDYQQVNWGSHLSTNSLSLTGLLRF